MHFSTLRLESPVNCIGTESVGYIIYVSLRSLIGEKSFDFNYIFIVGIYLLNNAKSKSKYDTRYFQSLIK
jgi:hypothetical protein